MVNRVVLGAFDGTYVLRASRPGFDVLNTGLTRNQLAFDSRWSETGLEFMSGTFAVDHGDSVTINYGTTFAQPPIVVLRCIGNGVYFALTDHYNHLGANNPFSSRLRVNVSSFSFFRGTTVPIPPGTGMTCHYTVYRNVYG